MPNFAALILLAIGAYCSLGSWAGLIWAYRTRRSFSVIPLIGGLSLALGAAMTPRLRQFALLAPLLDPSTILLVIAIPSLIKQFWETSRFNLLEEYIANRDRTTVSLRLYRNFGVILRWEVYKYPEAAIKKSLSRTGTWERIGEILVVDLGDQRLSFDPLPGVDKPGWVPSSGFDDVGKDPDFSLRELEFFHQSAY